MGIEVIYFDKETKWTTVINRKVSRVRVLVKIVSVAPKLTTVEEQGKERSCIFRRGDCRSSGRRPEIILGLSLCEDIEFRDDDDNFSVIFNVSNDQANGKLPCNED